MQRRVDVALGHRPGSDDRPAGHRARSHAGRPRSTRSRGARRRRSPCRPGRAAARAPRASVRASGPPATFALDCSTGQRTPANAGTGHDPETERHRVVAARQREAPPGWARSTVSLPGSSCCERRPSLLPELRQHRQRRVQIEEHHRRGLAQGSALERVQPPDHVADVAGVEHASPYNVSARKDRDPADAHAPLERLRRLADGHRVDPTTIRSSPARSGLDADDGVARGGDQRPHGRPLIGADLKRQQARPTGRRTGADDRGQAPDQDRARRHHPAARGPARSARRRRSIRRRRRCRAGLPAPRRTARGPSRSPTVKFTSRLRVAALAPRDRDRICR